MFSSFRMCIGKITWSSFMYFSAKKEARMLQKVLDKSSAKEDLKGYVPKILSKSIMPSAFENKKCFRRIINLNKIYMEHITQMLCNGKYSSHLFDLGIEISKVQLASGLNFLHIYWITKKADISEEIINDTLSKAIGELQQQMGSLRFMSKVPCLKFVKDLSLERKIQLDKIFEIADFGEDFKLTYQGKQVVTPDTCPKPAKLPEMRQNVLHLDHAKIKGRILSDISRFKTINFDTNKDGSKYEIPEKLILFNKKEFYKFYKRKRILALKMKKKSHPCVVEYADDDDESSFKPNYF